MAAATDAALVRRFREGDEEAFRALFEPHAALLAARAGRWLPPALRRKVSVSDIVQETRIVAFERRRDFEDRGEGAFRNWLLGIVDMRGRAALARFEGASKRAGRREVTRGQRPDTAHAKGREPSPSEHAIAGELRELARRAMAELPDHYREILCLAREQQLGLEEVARRMNRTHAAAKKLYGRALYRFTEIFERMRGGGEDG